MTTFFVVCDVLGGGLPRDIAGVELPSYLGSIGAVGDAAETLAPAAVPPAPSGVPSVAKG